jgi:hypothetical protein
VRGVATRHDGGLQTCTGASLVLSCPENMGEAPVPQISSHKVWDSIYDPFGGSHSSMRLPSGSITHANRPYS